ncbi:SDR family oxidoreductase [Glycomyces buryatensis]|uniref:Hydroxylase n=1 Tax=Glycomyces buryatensis TaxID=2570927 RepID=A0A4S8PUN6_9ACTN|nr:NmrA family NAD(P)-binding protein [Glycomyces buryatensis]THV35227.1 hydroxylase [Glycomyces buryatensis]
MTYVVHGATGAQGGPVVTSLATKGVLITALTRRTDADVACARTLAVDLDSIEQLTDAYRGSEGVFVHLPVVDAATRNTYAGNIITALREARPQRVVYSTSGFPADADPMAAALADSGLSYAVIAPRYYLENLLLPHVQEGIRSKGVLRYPLPTDFASSWGSHLDIADATLALFEQRDVTGVVEVGQSPAVTGKDLAEAFAAAYGRDVVYELQTPADFAVRLAPLMGADAAAVVQNGYEQIVALPDNAIDPERSAQRLLGLTPRTTLQWLIDLGLHQA